MRYGICAEPKNIDIVQAAGFDYIEPALAPLATLSEEDFSALYKKYAVSGIRAEAFNVFFPGSIRLTGPDVDFDIVNSYCGKALARASALGAKTTVVGSGGSRNIPDGFDRSMAKKQMVQVLQIIGDAAKRYGIIAALEPLNKQECNFINSIAEGAEMVTEAKHPNILLLADFYHMQVENEPMATLLNKKGILRHIHIANSNGRIYPVHPNEDNYAEFFEMLEKIKYNGRISVEASTDNLAADAPKALQLLKIMEDK